MDARAILAFTDATRHRRINRDMAAEIMSYWQTLEMSSKMHSIVFSIMIRGWRRDDTSIYDVVTTLDISATNKRRIIKEMVIAMLLDHNSWDDNGYVYWIDESGNILQECGDRGVCNDECDRGDVLIGNIDRHIESLLEYEITDNFTHELYSVMYTIY